VPEGDVVLRTARRLHEALAGHDLTVVDLRVPSLATVDLTSHQVQEVVAAGKHILVRIAPSWTLHSHLRMDGSWHVFAAGQRWTGGAGHTIRAVLGTAQWTAVGYRVHDLTLVRRRDEATLVGHLGPDLLGDGWDAAEAVRRLHTQPDREIGMALLDQRNLAGVGNVYRAETLFLSGVSPWTRVAAVPDVGLLVQTAHRLLMANRDRVRQVTTGVDRRGAEHWVYGRSGQPCRRCGTPIRSAMQGEPPNDRRVYWCPTCQPDR
jgi:endonuclease VIII